MENPITRTEQYLSAIAGNDNPVPDTPITREEQYLAAILENGSGADLSVIAPEYDPEDTYSEGDMRTHDGKLYKANQNISTAEEWDETHWTETDIATELADVADPEAIAEAVSDWLGDHVDPDTGYVIDDTLSIEDAAADAKKVGEEISGLKSAITQLDGAVEELEQGSLSALGATSGQVPTADGEGAWEWADPTGTGMEKVAVSGSTPSITAESNKLYICGEVSTLSITPPASGIFGVIFESGSTATVLTLGTGIIVPDWFDPDNLEADTIYELNVNEGLLTVGTWEAV